MFSFVKRDRIISIPFGQNQEGKNFKVNSPFRKNLIRQLVRELSPYVYGEQPKVKGLIKLNTNENPYPPSPRVLRVVWL